MKNYIGKILILASLVGNQFAISCTKETSATLTADVTPEDYRNDSFLRLPEQELKGLRADVTFRTLPPTARRTHAIDLCLTNRESSFKTNVYIQQIILAGFTTQFRHPPVTTLWTLGSSADYPMVASWNIYNAPLRGTLQILVRYEDKLGRGTNVTFQWAVPLSTPPL